MIVCVDVISFLVSVQFEFKSAAEPRADIYERKVSTCTMLLATAWLHNIIGREVLMLSRMILNLVKLTAAGLLFHNKTTQMLHASCQFFL